MARTVQTTVLTSALSLLAAPALLAQTNAALMLVPWTHEGMVDFRADGFYTESQASTTNADVDLSIIDARGRVRLHPGSSYNPSIGVDYTFFDMSTADPALPDELTDVSIAFGGSFNADLGQTLGGEWQMGYTLGVGYAGTTPFNDGDAWYGRADLFAIKPIDKDSRWLVGINYDGNRVFLPDVPLPAVSYFGRASETVTYAIGLPFSQLTWTPTDRWEVDIRSALFFSFTGRASYKATDDLTLFAAYVRRNDAFTINTVVDDRRLLFSQQRFELGLTYDLGSNLSLTVAGGLAFDQEIDVGYDTRDPTGLRDLDDSGYIRAGVQLRF